MKNNKIPTCVDCLHCKVSAISMEQERLCFCSFSKKQKLHKETYWTDKKVCEKFNDMR